MTRPYGLLVEDIKVNNTGGGVAFWLTWRMRMEPAGRVLPIPGTATPVGDHVWIRCDDPFGEQELDLKAEAQGLRQMFIDRGMHPSAMRVMRRPTALDGTEGGQ